MVNTHMVNTNINYIKEFKFKLFEIITLKVEILQNI